MCVATTVAACLAATVEVVGIAEPGDVVAHDRARRARRVEHGGAPRVDRQRHVERAASASIAGTTRSSSSASPTSGPGPALTPPTSRSSAPSSTSSSARAQERVERPRRPAVVERIGRPVEDAHHHRVARDVDRSVTKAQGGIRDDGHAGRPYASTRRRVRFRTRRRTNPGRRPCGYRTSGQSSRSRNRCGLSG